MNFCRMSVFYMPIWGADRTHSREFIVHTQHKLLKPFYLHLPPEKISVMLKCFTSVLPQQGIILYKFPDENLFSCQRQ